MRDLDLRDPELLTQSLVVSASAGSGKTFTLSVLVTAELGRGDLRPWEILATTFSEASAADLRQRLLRPLACLAALDEPGWQALLPHLDAPAADLAGLLRGLPALGHLQQATREVAEAAVHWSGAPWRSSPAAAQRFWRCLRREAELLQVSTIHSLAMRVLARGGGGGDTVLDVAHPALLRLLRQSVREALSLPEGHPDGLAARLLLAWAEANWEALSQGFDTHLDARGHLAAEAPSAPRAALERALAEAQAALAPFAADPERAGNPGSRSRRYFSPAKVLPLPAEGADLEARLRWAQAQSARADATKDYFAEAFRAALGAFQPVSDALEAWLRALLVQALAAFDAQKRAQGLATFGDLVRRAWDSLGVHGLGMPAPRLLLVDEYQDTSRVQEAFLEALGAARTVRVGDVKQAIYGFRGGDPDLLRDRLAQAGAGAFRLPTNFRSTPAVVALANTYVGEVWPRLDPSVRDLEGTQGAAAPGGCPVGLVRTPAPTPGGDLPALADWIAGLSREPGWTETLGAARQPGPRRRALLLKQRTRLPGLLQRLKARGIQPYVVAKAGFWESPGVRLLLAALEAVAHPERPLPCAALLRQVVGLSDAELCALARARGRAGLPGLGQLEPEALPEAHRPAARFLLGLRTATTQAIAGCLLRQGALLDVLTALAPHGALEPLRARRNLAGLLARLLELPAHPSVAYALLEDERNGVERGDLPAAGAEADLLIQTAHGSKGLEYDDVLLPLLNTAPRAFRKGELRTCPDTGALLLAWKLGNHPGRAYRVLKPLVESRQKRDELNLLYVALTRARERLCVLLQEPPPSASARAPKAPGDLKTWATWGQLLADAHGDWQPLAVPSVPGEPPGPAPASPLPPPGRPAVAEGDPLPADGGADPARRQARQDGVAMHAYLRELLVRWEAPEAFQACLAAPPPVAGARAAALAFLRAFEARGWRSLRRRTELPLAGAAASGAEGRADLVVWDGDRIHLLDFKHTRAFAPEERAAYGAQLARYAAALRAQEGRPVEAWLVPLQGGDWVPVPGA